MSDFRTRDRTGLAGEQKSYPFSVDTLKIAKHGKSHTIEVNADSLCEAAVIAFARSSSIIAERPSDAVASFRQAPGFEPGLQQLTFQAGKRTESYVGTTKRRRCTKTQSFSAQWISMSGISEGTSIKQSIAISSLRSNSKELWNTNSIRSGVDLYPFG